MSNALVQDDVALCLTAVCVACGAEEEGQEEYLLALESSEMANLRADVAAAGFLSGSGLSPGRLLRVAHALSRAVLMTFSGTPLTHSTQLPSATASIPTLCARISCKPVLYLVV